MEKRHREEISGFERIQLSVHTALCTACRQYERQSALIENLFSSKRPDPTEQEMNKASEALQEKILRQLDQKN
jgi:anti-sigma factor ChrR (cupin superfamily)